MEREGRDFESHWDRRKVRTRTLRVGDDFDLVVLGVGIGAMPHVCREIVARDPRWRAMVDHVKTVATQAFQIWMSADMEELGWTDAPIIGLRLRRAVRHVGRHAPPDSAGELAAAAARARLLLQRAARPGSPE